MLNSEWTTRIEELAAQFKEAQPYPYVVIPNFFRDDIAYAISGSFPQAAIDSNGCLAKDASWHVYDNPVEAKLTMNSFSQHGIVESLWKFLQSEEGMLPFVRLITGIDELEADPLLHGAGFHLHPPGGRLEMHLDYSSHPVTQKERRVNLIIYMTPEWNAKVWGGHLVLADCEVPSQVKFIEPKFNTAILMRTADESWHGVPYPIKCPTHVVGRKSVAVYYVSNPQASNAHTRPKAKFRPILGIRDDISDKSAYLELCKIRDERRLTPEDVELHMPGWQKTWQEPAPIPESKLDS